MASKAEVTEVSQRASALTKERIAHFESRYDEILQVGLYTNVLPLISDPKRRSRMNQLPPKNLLDRLDKQRTGILALHG